VCHALLQDIKFFKLLLHIDHELAAQTRGVGCPCGGILHQANYPRKPRGCPNELRSVYASRFSFSCNRCRKRATSQSVRFLGRRVYLALAVVLVSARLAGPTPAATRLAKALGMPLRTVQRWRDWWRDQFPLCAFWQATCARFMPPLAIGALPASLLERFGGATGEPMMRLLVFLTPITVGPAITLQEAR
jgi:hypothetical protein